MPHHPLAGLSLRQLIKKQPTFEDTMAELLGFAPETDDRAYAIIEGSKLESTLDLYLRRKMHHMSEGVKEEFFDKHGAPCSTFSDKLYIGYAANLYGEKTFSDLRIIKNIRNAFAHSKIHIDFETPAIERSCRNLRGWSEEIPPFLPESENQNTARASYGATCYQLKESFVSEAYPGGINSLGSTATRLPLD